MNGKIIMNDLVLNDGSHVFTTTQIIADGVGVDHRAVFRLVTKYADDFLHLETSGFKIRKFKTKGRDGELAELGEIHATFLITLMRNSDVVVAFKRDLTKDFFKQRRIISQLIAHRDNPEWQNVRSDGKIAYKQKTDVIKDFVEYATKQGSKSAGMYYGNLAKMENSSLFFIEQKYKNLRDIMTIKQLMQVCTADDVIDKALKEGMESELHYKDIYKLAKSRICAFAEIIGKSPVQNLLLTKGDQQ